ncbi:GNAT family N-acetyltransferase [Sphaerisporangium fuscum]|uniref:GNAT family N-acetyltransferase n=1 Tax=Sphaerisporangium fuscum TaxID=2835868 RepID=UPI001BDC0959|nr:GNAT family N-acetyltransferase [Sphaerisporangium fuscum]
MPWTFSERIAEFPDAAEAWLRRDPVRNTVPLTVLARVRGGLWGDGAVFGWLTDGGEVRGAVVHTPPYALLLADIPQDSVASLAEGLRERDLAGVSGPKDQVEAFASAAGREQAGRTSMRLYRLRTLLAASSTGAARAADGDDVELVTGWMAAFSEEAEPGFRRAGGREAVREDPRPRVEHGVRQGEVVLWEDGGRRVATAAFSRPILGMSRISSVYTPPKFRERGYGSAVTHAATRAAQDAGADVVVLFTNLANPTSNAIYQALGYRPVGDYTAVNFR